MNHLATMQKERVKLIIKNRILRFQDWRINEPVAKILASEIETALKKNKIIPSYVK